MSLTGLVSMRVGIIVSRVLVRKVGDGFARNELLQYLLCGRQEHEGLYRRRQSPLQLPDGREVHRAVDISPSSMLRNGGDRRLWREFGQIG
jgi:hypothetical protein